MADGKHEKRQQRELNLRPLCPDTAVQATMPQCHHHGPGAPGGPKLSHVYNTQVGTAPSLQT